MELMHSRTDPVAICSRAVLESKKVRASIVLLEAVNDEERQ